MNEIQQQIFDQYVEWLFDDGDDARTALRGLREAAPPEAVEPLIRFIEYAHVRYNERWTSDHYTYWNTNIEMARKALDAIYVEAGKTAFEDIAPKKTDQWHGRQYETVLVVIDKHGAQVAPDDFNWLSDFMAIGERREHCGFSIRKDLRCINERLENKTIRDEDLSDVY